MTQNLIYIIIYQRVLANPYQNSISVRSISKDEGVIYTDLQKPLIFIDKVPLRIEEHLKFDNNTLNTSSLKALEVTDIDIAYKQLVELKNYQMASPSHLLSFL